MNDTNDIKTMEQYVTDQDAAYMKRAIQLAKTAGAAVCPNPLVGAVIVKDGKVIGEGCHERYGELHAERNALKSCTEDPKDATVYVTLEPCCHQGKQPPCTDALIEAGIRKVYVGSPDPNPLASGNGIRILKEHGIDVVAGVLQDECDAMNKAFFRHITTGLPYVTMKYAMTLDGKIATSSGKSQWISCEESRKYVHRMRAEHNAIMAGIGTVLADDPCLNVRYETGYETVFDPVRIIVDTDLRIPLDAKCVRMIDGNYRPEQPRTIVATASDDKVKIRMLEQLGVKVLMTNRNEDGMVDLPFVMKEIGKAGISSVLLEGGGTLNWSMLKHGLVQKAAAFVSPKLFGGEKALSPVRGAGVDAPDEAFTLQHATARSVGSDLLIEGEIG